MDLIDSREDLIGHLIKASNGYSSYENVTGVLYRMNGGLWILSMGQEVWLAESRAIVHLRKKCEFCKKGA